MAVLERPAAAPDLPAIATLDAACFGNPWSEEVYRQELARALAELWVLDESGALLGYTCTWAVADEAHLLRIASHPERRRGGLGRRLLTSVLTRSSSAGCRSVILEVAAGNAAAVGLYRSLGFEEVGRRVGYYRHPPDDALTMRCPL